MNDFKELINKTKTINAKLRQNEPHAEQMDELLIKNK